MSNRTRILTREVERLELMVLRRTAAVADAQKALKGKRGKDPEGQLARRTARLATARHRLWMARERADRWAAGR